MKEHGIDFSPLIDSIIKEIESVKEKMFRCIISECCLGDKIKIVFDREIDANNFKRCFINGKEYSFLVDFSPTTHVYILSIEKTGGKKIIFDD